MTTDHVSKAEFRIGEDGDVAAFGIIMEPEMDQAKIWFRKVGEHQRNLDRGGIRATSFDSAESANEPLYHADEWVKRLSGFEENTEELLAVDERFRRLFKTGMDMARLF